MLMIVVPLDLLVLMFRTSSEYISTKTPKFSVDYSTYGRFFCYNTGNTGSVLCSTFTDHATTPGRKLFYTANHKFGIPY